MDGSVPSMETLTTPLSLDLSRDNQEDSFTHLKARAVRSRNASGGSNLNTVPESPVENTRDHDLRHYSTSESSSIGSYNKVGSQHEWRVNDWATSSDTYSPVPAATLHSIDIILLSSKEGPLPGSGEGCTLATKKTKHFWRSEIPWRPSVWIWCA